MNLHGKRVLLTGTGTGIGRVTAMLLAGRGARLVLLGRRPESLEALRAELPVPSWSPATWPTVQRTAGRCRPHWTRSAAWTS